jgi:glycosyltransferase involved in cell wall biosynthesis
MIVIEAAALGTPSVVVADPDNAAADLVVEGENGYVAPSASPEDLAAAIERVHAEGQPLRERTADWFRANARRLSLESSLETVLAAYARR